MQGEALTLRGQSVSELNGADEAARVRRKKAVFNYRRARGLSKDCPRCAHCDGDSCSGFGPMVTKAGRKAARIRADHVCDKFVDAVHSPTNVAIPPKSWG